MTKILFNVEVCAPECSCVQLQRMVELAHIPRADERVDFGDFPDGCVHTVTYFLDGRVVVWLDNESLDTADHETVVASMMADGWVKP